MKQDIKKNQTTANTKPRKSSNSTLELAPIVIIWAPKGLGGPTPVTLLSKHTASFLAKIQKTLPTNSILQQHLFEQGPQPACPGVTCVCGSTDPVFCLNLQAHRFCCVADGFIIFFPEGSSIFCVRSTSI